MSKFIKILGVSILVIGLFFAFSNVLLAQGTGEGGSDRGFNGLTNPLGADTLSELIDNIITGLRDTIAPPLVAVAVLYGGFLMLFAGGDPEKFAKGRKAILYAVIGYAIILIASGISSLIQNVVAG